MFCSIPPPVLHVALLAAIGHLCCVLRCGRPMAAPTGAGFLSFGGLSGESILLQGGFADQVGE
jgi:hypothetical protein